MAAPRGRIEDLFLDHHVRLEHVADRLRQSLALSGRRFLRGQLLVLLEACTDREVVVGQKVDGVGLLHRLRRRVLGRLLRLGRVRCSAGSLPFRPSAEARRMPLSSSPATPTWRAPRRGLARLAQAGGRRRARRGCASSLFLADFLRALSSPTPSRGFGLGVRDSHRVRLVQALVVGGSTLILSSAISCSSGWQGSIASSMRVLAAPTRP